MLELHFLFPSSTCSFAITKKRMLTLHLILLLLSSCLHSSSGASNKVVDTLLRLLPPEERLSSGDGVGDDPNEAYCESWRLSVETNNAGNWKKITSRCANLVEAYVRGPQYALDSKVVARYAQAYAKNIKLAGDGMDAWIFDVDETLISNIHHYFAYGVYRWMTINETALEQWEASTKSPALPWSLWLYKKLQGMGFQLILLTGRKETHRNSTEQNLLAVGYHSWEKLILRGNLDSGKRAMTYKSEKRAELVAQGYRIHGSSGDQWSDLMGEPMAKRSFKVPNPMYHIP